ncbi:MAG: respiratory nitrate reductase subunit gamma [candidate division Zixibacteria bacterium]|nr:respiratory nitrate reductase subunit gamma [candidate division Zixibacteria bacterium]
MGGFTVLQLLFYLSLLVFVIAMIMKALKISNMPLHLRWDLYPIPHEKGKAKYGGSYFEETDWWIKPKEISIANEIKEMGKEIIFVHSLMQNNRPLWVFSFPFHFGMYLLIGFVVMLALGAILEISGTTVSAASASGLVVIVHYLTVVLGIAGWILASFGALGLLLSRMFNGDLRKVSVRADYFNLVLLLAIFAIGLVSCFAFDTPNADLRGFVGSLISFEPAGVLPIATAIQLWLMAILLVYLPFTHMAHFLGKYFTYHKVRWEDAANLRGNKIEAAVKEGLDYQINWSASHIKSGGTWAEAATEESSKDE